MTETPQNRLPTPCREALESFGFKRRGVEHPPHELWEVDMDDLEFVAVLMPPPFLPPSLNVGVSIGGPVDAHFTVISRAALPTSQPSKSTGDRDFDARFVVMYESGDQETVRAMLGDAVRAAMCKVPAKVSVSLHQSGVSANFPIGGDDDACAALLREALPAMAAVGRASLEAARALPTPRALARYAPDFERAARALGLRVWGNALRARGVFDDVTLLVVWETADRGMIRENPPRPPAPNCSIRLTFARPLPGSVALAPAGFGASLLKRFGLGGWRVGDADFDRHWTVSAENEEAARAVFHPDLRAQIQSLADSGLSLRIDANGIYGHMPLPSATDTIPALLPALVTLARTLNPLFEGKPFR